MNFSTSTQKLIQFRSLHWNQVNLNLFHWNHANLDHQHKHLAQFDPLHKSQVFHTLLVSSQFRSLLYTPVNLDASTQKPSSFRSRWSKQVISNPNTNQVNSDPFTGFSQFRSTLKSSQFRPPAQKSYCTSISHIKIKVCFYLRLKSSQHRSLL